MASQSTFNWDVDTWKSLDCYFNQSKILAQHQLDSYNNLVDYLIPQIIERNNPLTIVSDYKDGEFRKSVVIEFGQTYLSKPLIHENTDVIKPLYPSEARLRGLTYAAPMFIDVKCTMSSQEGQKPTRKTETLNKIPFMKLPVMLHSKYCHLSDHNESTMPELGECEYDQGGYFIVNGNEKVLISQERVAENQVFVFTPPKTVTGKFTHEADIKTSIDQRFYPVKSNKVRLSKEPTTRSRNHAVEKGSVSGRCLYVHMPLIKEDVPLFIVFRALGILQDKEIFEMIMPDLDTIDSNYTNFLIPSVDEARFATVSCPTADGGIITGITTQEIALRYLAERLNITFGKDFKEQHKDCQIKYVKDVLSRELFPHIGQIGQQIGQTFRKKAFFLGYMTRKLIDCYFGVRPFDDRDHYGNKRVDLAGPLLNKLFRVHFIKLLRDIKSKILSLMGDSMNTSKILQTLRDLIKGCIIDTKIKYGLSTGNWNTQKSSLSTSNKGIAQVLNRLSFAGALSHIRRIQSPLERAGSKIVPPRRLHGTHFGMCCPNETPEGQQIGIVKNLAMQTHVTIQSSDYPMRIILNKLGVIDLIEVVAKDVRCCTKIFINGEWFGVVNEDETYKLYQRLKILKRHGVIVPYISIAWFIDWKEIHIQTDGGRYSRPLYIVEDNKLIIETLFNENLDFQKKFKEGSIKWAQLLMGFGVDAKSANSSNGGVIEYMDTNEIETSMVAMTRHEMDLNDEASKSQQKSSYYVKFTHCEIHPMMMMGVIAAMIPFSDHNQSPRNCYQCLWKEEDVIMADGSRKKIADIKVGESVLTVDPNTLEYQPSVVINQYVKPTDKPVVTIRLLSGRKIVCTADHPVLTLNGWKDAGQLTTEDLVCVCPIKQFYSLDKNDLVIDERMFGEILGIQGFTASVVNKHCQELIDRKLLPLYQNSEQLPILARILGFCIANGSICIHQHEPQMTMKFGLKENGENYLNDVSKLGFEKHQLHCVAVSSQIHGWQCIYNNALVSLIIVLGATLSKEAKPLPIWIKNGSLLVKREFLSGFLSGDGCKIRINHLKGRKSPNVVLSVTSFSKCLEYMDSLKVFMSEISELFMEFDIICKKVHIVNDKYHSDRFVIQLPFECVRQNIINYFEKIGYSYDLYKYRDILPIYEYLKYHQFVVEQFDVLKKHVVDLRNKGLSYQDISKQIGVSTIECADLYRCDSCSPNNYMTIDRWFEKIKMVHNSLFIPINKVETHDNVEIADITTESDNHSFITGSQICVHNSSMAKQSIGYYVTNYNSRMDTLAHVLVYGHKPLVSTRMGKYVIMDKLPHGVTAMLLYACYTGYNQEDSIIVNGDAVERGFFNTLFFRTYVQKAQKNKSVTTATERFTKPEPDKNPTRDAKSTGTYDAINRDGVPIIGKTVRSGDVIIGKVIELKEAKDKDKEQEFIYKDVSETIKQNEHGTVDKVIPDPDGKILPFNSEGNRIVKARVAILRKPEIGDKFASRYSQKGTTGILYKSIDMPFTSSGLVPDMIMNPHGIPSRMTVGKLLETLLGKVAVCTGKFQDATPFISYEFDDFGQTLKQFGLNEFGNEVMYNGQTGQMFDATFFYGPTYYQRLKHMVDDKIHCLKADHEILTSSGWKMIPDVTLEDEVATLKEGKLVYEKPTNILQYPNYSGKMYHVKNQQIDLDVTINHRMWISVPYGRKKIWLPHRLVKAEELVGKHVKYQKDAQWYQPDYQFILPSIEQVEEKVFDMDAWLTFFGIWITEGWTTSKNRVQICQCKQRVKNVIFDVIKTLGYRQSNSNDDEITICDKQLHTYMSQYSIGAPNKFLPAWVWKLSQQQCQKLIYNMQLGDGTFTKNGGSCYYTSSIRLADDFMRLCLHAGWSSNKTKHQEVGHSTTYEGRQITTQHDIWRLSVITSKNHPAVNHGHHKEQQIQTEEVYDYTGPVYCLQVPSEVFYVRHNGLPVWTGNSRESGPVQLLTRQPAEGRSRDGGLRLGEMERDCFIAHGIPKFLKERMMDSSDLFKVYVSKKEEAMVIGNPETNLFKYNGQHIKGDEIMQIQLPYAMKLLLQELESMGIDVRLQVA